MLSHGPFLMESLQYPYLITLWTLPLLPLSPISYYFVFREMPH
jgi:hypothetical protein